MNPNQPPTRVRVTGPRRDVRRAVQRTVTDEIDDQTRIGTVYLLTLVRTQLRLGLATVALVVVPLAFMPLVFGLWPDVQDLHVGPLPLWWAILGFAVYPAILGVGWWYVKASTRNEQQFADLVEER